MLCRLGVFLCLPALFLSCGQLSSTEGGHEDSEGFLYQIEIPGQIRDVLAEEDRGILWVATETSIFRVKNPSLLSRQWCELIEHKPRSLFLFGHTLLILTSSGRVFEIDSRSDERNCPRFSALEGRGKIFAISPNFSTAPETYSNRTASSALVVSSIGFYLLEPASEEPLQAQKLHFYNSQGKRIGTSRETRIFSSPEYYLITNPMNAWIYDRSNRLLSRVDDDVRMAEALAFAEGFIVKIQGAIGGNYNNATTDSTSAGYLAANAELDELVDAVGAVNEVEIRDGKAVITASKGVFAYDVNMSPSYPFQGLSNNESIRASTTVGDEIWVGTEERMYFVDGRSDDPSPRPRFGQGLGLKDIGRFGQKGDLWAVGSGLYVFRRSEEIGLRFANPERGFWKRQITAEEIEVSGATEVRFALATEHDLYQSIISRGRSEFCPRRATRMPLPVKSILFPWVKVYMAAHDNLGNLGQGEEVLRLSPLAWLLLVFVALASIIAGVVLPWRLLRTLNRLWSRYLRH